jgi:hypothetical protein
MYNQRESFICLDLIVKNSNVAIERYFKWQSNIKLKEILYTSYVLETIFLSFSPKDTYRQPFVRVREKGLF